MKQYKLYLFDLDGTLIDSDQMLIATFRELYEKYRPGFYPDDSYIRLFSGPQISETLSKEFPDQDLDLMLDEYRSRSQKYYDQYVRLFPGALTLIKKLHENGIPYAVITNKHSDATKYTYQLLDLEKFGIYSVCADDVTNLKPAADGVKMAMDKFGIKNPSDVIYIGDGYIDYLTAHNSGVDFGYTAWSPRPKRPDMKIDVNIESFVGFAGEIE